MIYRIVAIASVTGCLLVAGGFYRNSLIKQGYNQALAEFEAAETLAKENHAKELAEVSEKTGLLQEAYERSLNEINTYHDKFYAVSKRLRNQQEVSSAAIEKASCPSVGDYAKAVESNLAGCAANLERFGVEAASCSGAAETLKSALDLANE